MSLGTPAAVLLAILFLIPGFIWRKTSQLFSPYAPSGKIELLDCLMLSCWNYLFGLVFIFLLLVGWPPDLDLRSPETVVRHPWFLAAWLALVFIYPVFWGWVTAKFSACRKVHRLLSKFGVSILHPAPTGWDYAFAREERYWARIELTDGQLLEGLFGENSLVSGKPEERDVFLEQLFEWDEEKQRYNTIERNAGVWVSANRIKTIAFFQTQAAQADSAKRLDIVEKEVHNTDQVRIQEDRNNV